MNVGVGKWRLRWNHHMREPSLELGKLDGGRISCGAKALDAHQEEVPAGRNI